MVDQNQENPGFHPSLSELEALRSREGEKIHSTHIESCVDCQERLNRLEALARELSQTRQHAAAPIPRKVDRKVSRMIRERAQEIRRRERDAARENRLAWLFPKLAWAGGTAVAALLTFLLVTKGIDETTLRRTPTTRMPGMALKNAPGRHGNNPGLNRRISILKSDPARLKRRVLKGDLDGDGRVDIVDAYLMARRLGRGQGAPKGWDQNRDGRVDRRDVEAVALSAVALNKEGI